MSETCAVCKQGKGPEKCEICGFSDNGSITRDFITKEDAEFWLSTVVKPYRKEWEFKKREAELLERIEELSSQLEAYKKFETIVSNAYPSVITSAEEKPDLKYCELFIAYAQGNIPSSRGYIITSSFDDKSPYSVYIIRLYTELKQIYKSENGLTFVTDGKKINVIAEPAGFTEKHIEPNKRLKGEIVPESFSQLDVVLANNQTKIMISRNPNNTSGYFSIQKPIVSNFSVVFEIHPDIYKTLNYFFVNSLYNQRKFPETDAITSAIHIVEAVKRHISPY